METKQNITEDDGKEQANDESCILVDSNLTTIEILDETAESGLNSSLPYGDFQIIDEVADEETGSESQNSRRTSIEVNGTLVSFTCLKRS